jgi:hypothetical protein
LIPTSQPTEENSKWIKDLNVSPLVVSCETTKGKHRKTLQDTVIGSNFQNRTPIAQEIITRIDKYDRIKLKSFYTSEETFTQGKRQPAEWEKIFASYSSDRKLISRMKNSKIKHRKNKCNQ